MKLQSRVGFIILVLALLGLIYRSAILATGPISIALQTLAVVLMIWARVTFGRRSFHATADPTEGGLVTTGPYAYIRHPIYAAILLFMLAAVATHLSVLNMALGAAAITGVMMRVLAEERLVTERYPEYVTYASRTKRFIPLLL